MSLIAQSNQLVKNRRRTPCIGVCSTGIGDSVCRGCKRFLHEVVNWNAYSVDEQHHVWRRLETFLEQIVAAKLTLVNQDKLKRFLQQQGIAFSNYQRPMSWVYALLKAGAGQMEDWQHYGIQVLPVHQYKSAIELRDEIDNEFYQLSRAHYQRYFEAEHVVD